MTAAARVGSKTRWMEIVRTVKAKTRIELPRRQPRLAGRQEDSFRILVRQSIRLDDLREERPP